LTGNLVYGGDGIPLQRAVLKNQPLMLPPKSKKMKATRLARIPSTIRGLLTGTSVAVLLLSASSLSAADLTWDTTSGDSAITGGAGTWDTTLTNWSADGGLTDIAWVNPNNDTALFSGTGGTVALVVPITAGGLTFNSTGYTIASNTLTLAGTAAVSVTNSGDTATISSIITGSAGLSKSGAGTLTLSSTGNSFSGGVNIGGGTLSIAAANNLPSGNALTLSNGGVLAVSGNISGAWRTVSPSLPDKAASSGRPAPPATPP
jgi:fibronectin-binding autotransporter adhesin